MHGIANSSPRADCSGTSIAGYAGLLLGGRTILHRIMNNSLRVDYVRNQYHRVLLGGRTILHGIANSSPRANCSVTSIAGYAGLLLGGHKILHGITSVSPRVGINIARYSG